MGLKQLEKYPQLPYLRVLPKESKQTIYFHWPITILMAGIIGTIIFQFDKSKPGEETIEKFIEKSLMVKDSQLKYDLCDVTTKQANKIMELTGIDVTGFKWTIDNYTVRHVLSHKDIGLNDYQKLCISFNTYDSLKFASKQFQDVKRLELYKKYDRIIKIIIEVRSKELYIVTMFKP